MYGYLGFSELKGSQMIVNEMAIQNMLMVAGNPQLMNMLDKETAGRLLEFVNSYTKGNLDQIERNEVHNKHLVDKDYQYNYAPLKKR